MHDKVPVPVKEPPQVRPGRLSRGLPEQHSMQHTQVLHRSRVKHLFDFFVHFCLLDLFVRAAEGLDKFQARLNRVVTMLVQS